MPLLPVVLGVGNCCLSAEARDESADSDNGLVMAVVVGHDWRGGGESVVRDDWTWYRGRGCEDGRADGQEDECEDCDGEWFMWLHGEKVIWGQGWSRESSSWCLPLLEVSSRRFNMRQVEEDELEGNNECLRIQICIGSTAG